MTILSFIIIGMQRATRRFIIFVAFFMLLSAVVGLMFWPLIRELQGPEYQERFSAWIASLGPRGVLLLFGMQVLQTVLAPVPGGPVQVFAGVAYGVWGGLVIMLAGSVAATILIFSAVRKFGLPLLRRFLGDDALSTWGFLASEKTTSLVVFILFLIPGTPKGFLTYMGPLTRLSLVQFTLISTFGRFPALLSSTAMGDAAMRGNWVLFLIIFGITGLAGIMGIQFRERMNRRFSSG